MARQSSTRNTSVDVEALQKALEQNFADDRWLRVLRLFSHTGVADTGQTLDATGLSRDRFEVLLEHFHDLAGDEILTQTPFSVPRPGVRGRPPIVYTLGPAGAALLRANGYPDAHACGLNTDTQVAHARAVLDVRLAAEAAGLEVRTEREIPYIEDGKKRALRPDNAIKLPDDTQALFEIEQSADLTLLRRIRQAVRHKSAFFQADESRAGSSTVRVLIDLPRGRTWDRTVATWERATAIVADEEGGKLPFKIVAIPLRDFIEQPDWGEPVDAPRWESLFDPAQTSVFEPAPSTVGNEGEAKPPARRTSELPAALERRSLADDRYILQAYWQRLLERGPALLYSDETPRPDLAFFEVMAVIYAASHRENPTPRQEAAYPFHSIYLLRKYLELHPQLHQGLSKAVTRGSSSIRWSASLILHRMQVVIQTFLRYHGWQVSRALKAHPIPAWSRRRESSDFGVGVQLDPEVLMEEGEDGIVPGREEAERAGHALAWVLWALFSHADDIGLKRASFW